MSKYSNFFPEGFPERLNEAIDKSGLSNNEIIRRAKCSKTQFYCIRNAEVCPNLMAAARLSVVLGVSLDYLVFGKERPSL